MTQEYAEPAQIAYATPATRPGTRVLAASMILVGGLVLIGLGGCFMIGVMIIVCRLDFNLAVQSAPIQPADILIAVILSALALAAFVGAVVLLVAGTKALLRIAQG